MPLDPAIAAQVAHLFDATLAQLLSGEIDGVAPAAPLLRDDVERTDLEVPGPAGPVRVRWYRSVVLDPDEPAPALVWAHGGGWQYGDLDMPEADSVAQVVAGDMAGVVVSVDYRLAPQHRHPAALDDVLAAYDHVVREGAGHGVDTDRVALGGASAGGLLAAAAALVLGAAGRPPAALVLAYPVTDPDGGPYDDECDPDCPPVLWLGHEGTTGLFANYLDGDPAAADAPIVPARGDLSVLPPTLVTTAECDSLRPQGVRFVELARAAGVAVEHHDVAGVLHGYLNTVGDQPLADAALDRHVAWLWGSLGAA